VNVYRVTLTDGTEVALEADGVVVGNSGDLVFHVVSFPAVLEVARFVKGVWIAHAETNFLRPVNATVAAPSASAGL
jgi:hypothetical protein